MSVRAGVIPLEPTAPLHDVLRGLDVRLGADPTRETFWYADYVDMPESLIAEVAKRCRFYGYQLQQEDAEVYDEDIFTESYVPKDRFEYEAREALKEIHEAATEILRGGDAGVLAEELILMEDAAREVVNSVKQMVNKLPELPKNKKEFLNFFHDYVYGTMGGKGLNLPADTPPDVVIKKINKAANRSMAAFKKYKERHARQLEQEVKKHAPRNLLQKIWDGIVWVTKWAARIIKEVLGNFWYRVPYAGFVGFAILLPAVITMGWWTGSVSTVIAPYLKGLSVTTTQHLLGGIVTMNMLQAIWAALKEKWMPGRAQDSIYREFINILDTEA